MKHAMKQAYDQSEHEEQIRNEVSYEIAPLSWSIRRLAHEALALKEDREILEVAQLLQDAARLLEKKGL